MKLSPAAQGINIEPSIALSPSGQVGYCVWIHDPTHKDLVATNRGRRLLYAVYSKSTNSWSAPQSVLPVGDYDTKYPGVLEPSIALKDDQNGLLAFTAVKAGSAINDTGLGGNSFVYISRLTNGVFGPPIRIHGRCLKRSYGWAPVVINPGAVAVAPDDAIQSHLGDWVISFQGTGPAGLTESSGNVMLSTLPVGSNEPTPAVAQFDDGNIRSNVAVGISQGTVRSLSLNSGPALVTLGGGGQGGGLPRERLIEAGSVRLEADLGITDCRLSDPFSAPGSNVVATVDIENIGLAGSAEDKEGKSVVGVKALFISDDGTIRVAATAPVPVLAPMQATRVEMLLEMPHDPVRVRVVLDPNPIDRDRTNDTRECYFGAPCPRDMQCEVFPAPDFETMPAARVSWTSPIVYDELLLCRDGGLIAILPGGCTRFVDQKASPGSHLYEVRGRLGASKSRRVSCEAPLPPPPPPPTERNFRRGDVDGNVDIEITDAIALLGYLFTGGREPACLDAADSDDSGELDITDAIAVLGYLFTGGRAPAAPGPETCGADPSEDTLAECKQEVCP